MARISIGATKLLTLTLLLLQNVCCDDDDIERSLSTSVVGMEFLLEMESKLLTAMENYANQMENKLQIIRGAIREMQTESLKSQIDPEEYLSNPINSYALIRRLHADWEKWEQFLRTPVAPDEINRIKRLLSDKPTSVDLMEATEAIYRLSAISDINPEELAMGLINGKQYDAHFSSIDCFNIGYLMFKSNLYYLSSVWLYSSLELYKDSDINGVLEFDEIKIYELYAEALLKQGHLNDALEVVEIALNLNSHKTELLRKKSEIEFMIKTPTETVAETIEQADEGNFHVNQAATMKYDCRQRTYHSKLHCLYNKTTTAFLQLAPLKMEILSLDPYVVLYHDVISNREIAKLKNEARNNLRRSRTIDINNSFGSVNKDRTVKGYGLIPYTKISNRIHRRITDMSGFDLWDSDNLEILNYGMAGHYRSHFDFFNYTQEPKAGDRIATVIFYLSNVEQGGETVFPSIEISVLPKKGTAILWYNLDAKSEVDTRVLHGACPVIVGSKWVLTKWIRQYSQMFRKPCIA